MLPPTPRLRQDLEITPQVGEGGFVYLIKDPVSNVIFEFGEEEYFLSQRLDGKTLLVSILADFQQVYGFPLEFKQLEAFVRKLEAEGLLVSALPQIAAPSSFTKLITLFHSDHVIDGLAQIFGFCFTLAFVVASGFMIIVALGISLKYFSVFTGQMKILWRPGPFFLETFLGLFVVNVACEVGKAIACRHYGGHINKFNIFFAYRILPHFYFEMSTSLWLMKETDRLRVFSSGLYLQLLLWAVSIFGWKITVPSTGVHNFCILLTLASGLFFLFNLIPLVPRDGYYLLSTWLEIPDLWKRSRELVKAWIFRRPLPEPLSSQEILFFKWFGVLSLIFGVLVWVILMTLVAYLIIWHWRLKGMGAFLFMILIFLRFEDSLKEHFMRLFLRMRLLTNETGAIKMRFLVKIGLVCLFIIILLLPYPFEPGGEFKLIPINQVAIRAEVPGEIEKVLVEENQWVEKDQPVATFLAKDQLAKVGQTRAALENAQEKLTMYYNGPKPEEVAKAEQEVKLAAKTYEYSEVEAKRSHKMFMEKAISEKDHQATLKTRDGDLEKLGVAKKNLEVVKSWPRPEEIKMQEAEVRRLKAELALAEKDLQLTTLVSPAPGRIITAYPLQKVRQYLEVGDVFAVVEDSRIFFAEVEVPEEDAAEVKIGASVKLKTWVYPTKTFQGKVTAIAPVGYEKSWHRVQRTLSEKEFQVGQKEVINQQGKVVRVLSEFPNSEKLLKTDMTGYAKIEGSWKPVGVAFTRWLMRFLLVEVWSWFP